MSGGAGPGAAVPPAARYGLAFIGILLVAANQRASITSIGPVLGDIRADLGISGTAASVLVVIPLIAFAAVSPVAPAIAARLGIERSLGAALLLLAASIVLRSAPWAPGIWLGTAGLGAAIAVINVLLPALIKRDYPTRIGRLTGVYTALSGAAAAAGAGLAVPLAGADGENWRLALGVWAGLAIIAFAIFLPQLTGPRRGMASGLAGVPAIAAAAPFRSPWRTSMGWQITVYMGMQSTLYYALITWWPSIEQSQGFPAATTGLHQVVFQVLGVTGSLLAATLIHRRRDQRPIIATSSGLMLVAIAGQLAFPALAIVWVGLAGLSSGTAIVVALSLFGLRTRHHGQAAALSGMAQSIGYLLAATGPLLIGVLHDSTGGWTVPLFALLGVLVVQIIMGLLAGRDRQMAD